MVVLPFEPAWTEVPSVKTVIRAQMNIDNLYITFISRSQISPHHLMLLGDVTF